MGDLIPGLPDDLATECLIRIHCESFPNAILTCKNWKHMIGSPGYLHKRIVGGHSQSIVIMALGSYHCIVLGSEREPDRLVVCEMKTGIWSELPPIPGYVNALPIYCIMAVVGLNLVVIGGQRPPQSSRRSKEVFIYSFISNTWQRGADMLDDLLPGCFWCVSDSDRTVYVVGKFYDEKMKLMISASTYDLAKDEWVKLPDMDTEVACGGVHKITFRSGKLHVLCRYFSKKFMETIDLYVQTFDPATSTWGTVCTHLKHYECESNVKVAGPFGNVHVCRGGAVAVIAEENCQKIADLPIERRDVGKTLTSNKHFVVCATSFERETNKVYLLDLESKEWSNFEPPKGRYSEHIEFVCTVEI